jgi:hypothetical protein
MANTIVEMINIVRAFTDEQLATACNIIQFGEADRKIFYGLSNQQVADLVYAELEARNPAEEGQVTQLAPQVPETKKHVALRAKTSFKTFVSEIAHVINAGGSITVRRPFDPVANAMKAMPIRYDSKVHKMAHENSTFLEHVMGGNRFMRMSAQGKTDGEIDTICTWLSNIARNGWKWKSGANKTMEQWKFLYGDYSDKGSLILVSEDEGIESLDDLGIHVMNPQKAPKRIKRVMAPHEYACFGTINSVVEDEFGEIIEFDLDNGYIGRVRNFDLDKLPSDLCRAACDGMAWVNTNFMIDQLGVIDRNPSTYGFKGTVFCPLGLGKGFFFAKDDLEYDIVTYGAKKDVVFDEFFFGSLGSLKPGVTYMSDIQSLVNFGLYPWAPPATRVAMAEFVEALKNPVSFNGWVLSHLKNVTKVEGSPSATETWRLVRALERGVDVFTEPGLFRAVCQQMILQILDCENGRIPFDMFGSRNDICADPNMFDAYGMIHPEWSVIPDDCIVNFGVPQGPVECYRQPNGHALEKSSAMNVHLAGFEKYASRQRNYYSAQGLLETLILKNGADLDDTECTIHDPEIVKHMRGLSYPVTQKREFKAVEKKRMGPTYDALRKQFNSMGTHGSFTAKDFLDLMNTVRATKIILGAIVRCLELDTLDSGEHKANMLAHLADMINAEQDKDRKIWILNRRDWLKEREDYQLRDIATNLEAVVDYCILGRGDYKAINAMSKQCSEMRANTEVFPMLFTKHGPISSKKQLGIDYLLAPSLACVALAEVEELRKEFQNDLRALEWKCITFVPDEVNDYFGFSQDISTIARDIRKDFNIKVAAAMSIDNRQLRQDSYNKAIYGNFHKCILDGEGKCPVKCPRKGELIEEGLKQWMECYDEDTCRFIAVEMKRLCHHSAVQQLNEDGTVRGVPDGVFNNNIIYNYYLDALDECGLTGKYLPVDLDQTALKQRVKDKIFDVVVSDRGVVLRKSDNFWVGTVDASNGEYRLVNGMLEIRKPSESLASEFVFEEGDFSPVA